MSHLTLVSNRLPIRINEEGEVERTTGGLASALAGAGIPGSFTWIGWGGVNEEDIEDREDYEKKLKAVGVKPVILETDEFDAYYEGYSNSTLWPMLHYMKDRARFDPEWMEGYRGVNQKFAEVVAKEADQDGEVWIHDYHLMLVPKMLRKLRPDLKIGFFLHTPWPSSEIIRALPERNEILEGLLGCDVIGFHTYNYLRHFRSCLLRILGIEGESEGLWHGDRMVRMGVYPIGHNSIGFQEAMQSDTYREALALHKKRLDGGKLILSVERLDYTKGVPEKLDAIREFLKKNPEQRSQVNFVIIAVPSRVGVEEYNLLAETVQREVGAINGDYGEVGHSPVQFLHRGFPMEELAAFYALAEVCMVTPIIDGMNLVAKEYIDCKRKKYDARAGVLILSEFAGAAQEMSHSLLINPHDTQGVVKAMEQALAMSEDEMWSRVRAMQDRLARNDAGAWARHFLGDLDASGTPEHDPAAHETLAEVEANLTKHLAAGRKVALFLDYDGTLRDFVDRPEDAVPDASLLNLLERLAAHDSLNLAVISGRPKEFLESHIGHLPIDLVAEHGYYWKRLEVGEWELMNPHVDNSWMETVRPVLEWAVTLTPGSEIEVKTSSIVWHYRQADPEFGLWRAKGLLDELTAITASLPVSVHHGQKIVEVASQMVNKGVAADSLMRDWMPDIAFAAGDDQTDETMFAITPVCEDHFHTVKIGTGSTRAEHRTSIKGLRRFLESLADTLSQQS
ncbi:bifunctional alpha,alpha-trehalose-phosphate synthase (UDP-forming)/trehalose-phosphatase [Verrucomicrobiaceae bacterium R5-34]|uniref:Bifunctional alpha,alpha-trehalose-phosphate synthase (UDP-forming)/trehalose-phosphatase n=1 Tax=Oceaniferula flava TaxID=2800421 RepID=A0AAE2S9E3_9BACT|nr:bifunctional alpha,alpha-trehalose-phosphate synthase (UDP-forming)/trehalose-phosphatase [Oceaniferula flavus]MBK1829501.1 bifunctional alpha,alpha-trehalose-phosphate synthase (UDP-forming)/trehalose-phosphatase [Verrucomicrobiaceae bacterium R5-34]MBK1853730.1 bifunctional alpha,alpha-trehalose-phosphate synthase (UDP-forming)/trehalose-phosphatase [Oceaniferula flavus]MBM1135036.1 bifunctional alpha,alpha-trehalose-phosphate synthase (UDP-forming)/trehalose-phosphatase [Oceaniferula flavu